MKKTFLLGFCIINLFSSFAQGSYRKFIVDGASWVVSRSYCAALTGCDPGNGPWVSFYDTYYYKLHGDTLIGSVRYAEMFLSVLTTCPQCGPPYNPPVTPNYTPYQLIALLTEDTIGKKVYYKSVNPFNPYQCGIDSLFMDFSMAVGDSFEHSYSIQSDYYPGLCDTNGFIIDSVGLSGFQTYNVKTWYIRNANTLLTNSLLRGPDFKLYEGIGYSFGLFDLGYIPGDGTDYEYALNQYCEPGDSSCASPLRTTGVTDLPINDITVSLQPNPASDILMIKSLFAQIKHVEIFDLDGQRVLTSSSNRLSVSSLEPSVYIVIIYTDMGIAYRKLVRQ